MIQIWNRENFYIHFCATVSQYGTFNKNLVSRKFFYLANLMLTCPVHNAHWWQIQMLQVQQKTLNFSLCSLHLKNNDRLDAAVQTDALNSTVQEANIMQANIKQNVRLVTIKCWLQIALSIPMSYGWFYKKAWGLPILLLLHSWPRLRLLL